MACQVSGTLESHGDPSLGLLSIKDNGFYVHREVTLILRLAQSKQTGIVKIKILSTPWLTTRSSCNERLASLLENTAGPREQERKPAGEWQVRETLPDMNPSNKQYHTPGHMRSRVPQGRRKKFFKKHQFQYCGMQEKASRWGAGGP